ncbi:MAG: hypothetical protein GC162_03495 [Planctomycetes bacterium]|nr:hypothetical protein [Planctomycetota bacterium]
MSANSRSRHQRLSLTIAIIALAAGAILFATGEAYAGSRVSFGISVGSGGCYSPGYSSFGFGYSHYRNYCGPSYRGYYSHTTYYRPYNYCPPPVYCPPQVTYVVPPQVNYVQGVAYTPNTAVVITPPQAQPVVTETATPASYTYPYINNSSNTTVVAPANPATPPVVVSAPQTLTDGFGLLRGANTRGALDAFAAEAERFPNAGLPKVGYAIAAGLNGDDAKAAWALRSAVEMDASGLDRVPTDAAVQAMISNVLHRYEQRQNGFSRADDAFMIAACRYLLHDYAGAQTAIASAAATGDNAATTQTLRAMITQAAK